jgi:hypothetical protein
MDRKAFEIIAECEMAAFPTTADISKLGEQIETARRSRPEIVQATVKPPATYREKQYRLPTGFVVWAKEVAAAVQAVEGLLKKAGVPCRVVLPSGRALAEADLPQPNAPEKPAAVGRSVDATRRRPPKKRRTLKAQEPRHRSSGPGKSVRSGVPSRTRGSYSMR